MRQMPSPFFFFFFACACFFIRWFEVSLIRAFGIPYKKKRKNRLTNCTPQLAAQSSVSFSFDASARAEVRTYGSPDSHEWFNEGEKRPRTTL